MSGAAAGTATAIGLLVRLRMRRLANLLSNGRWRPAPKSEEGVARRPATPAKRRLGALLAVIVAALMLASFVLVFHQGALSMQCHLTPGSACAAALQQGQHGQGMRIAAEELAQLGIGPQVKRTLAFQLGLLMLAATFGLLGAEQVSVEDWDLEWLATLPIGRRTLLFARIVERSLVTPTGILSATALCLPVAWMSGWRWAAMPLALAAALALQPFMAVLRTVVDTGLRVALSPSNLRNLLALVGLGAVPFLFVAMGFGTGTTPDILWTLARALPAWIDWTPPALALAALAASTPGAALVPAGLLLAQVGVVTALGVLALGHQLRGGIVRSGARESGRRPSREEGARPSRFGWLGPASPVQRRELRLLARDRQFLVQCMVMPLIVCGNQLFLNAGRARGSFWGPDADPRGIALTAFLIGAYTLLMSAFQTVSSEGRALWMLYGFPRTIDSVLRDKARLWGMLALTYPVLLFGISFALGMPLGWHIVSLVAVVAIAIPIFAFIAVALGVFASDPLSHRPRPKMRPSYVYLFMTLAGLYSSTLYADHAWQVAIVLVLVAGLAQALWQKARDALPYLLDPAAAPPSRVSTADGMIAALSFFVLQTFGSLFLRGVLHMELGPALVVAYAGAGLVVYVLARLVFWKLKTTGVPALLAPGRAVTLPASLGVGLVAGLAAAAVGIAYLVTLRGTAGASLPPIPKDGLRLATPWLFALAVLAAPLCEEFIFRGLLFGGLRRSMGLMPSMLLSAGLFAIVHPPVSMLPVFVLGLCTAWAHERGKGLLAPMLVHALYNAAVLGFQLGFPLH